MITEEDKRLLVNLAMKIDVGIVPVWAVVAKFDEDKQTAIHIMEFWGNFNDMTKSVAERVGYEKCRQHLENCYEIGNNKWTNKNLKTIVSGLKLTLYGVKECITGVLKDIINL